MKKLKQLYLEYIDGKKTHLVALALTVLNLGVALNLISPAHLVQINMVLGALGLSALRSGISKIE